MSEGKDNLICKTEGCPNEKNPRAIYCQPCAARRQKESYKRYMERKKTGAEPIYARARKKNRPPIGKTVSALLNTNEFCDELTTESEIFCNVFYVVKGGSLHIYSYQDDKLNVISGRIPELKDLLYEIDDMLDTWDGVRT